MTKAATLNELGFMMEHIVKHMATKEDIEELKAEITGIKNTMPTKDQIITLHSQVNSIEAELHGMRHDRIEIRVGDLEEKVFGEARA